MHGYRGSGVSECGVSVGRQLDVCDEENIHNPVWTVHEFMSPFMKSLRP